ncbi:DUF1877 family protein [Streptomyces sp. NPDC087440]|uniref:DUF1877 family protein n=1 Tax=Streptomyces sp. NPDC087440 TaxID=3365790 RepID=UPI0038270364
MVAELAAAVEVVRDPCVQGGLRSARGPGREITGSEGRALGSSMLLRRVSPEVVSAGGEILEAGFDATESEEVYAEERENFILCDVGQQWQMMDALISGNRQGSSGPECLPVLGGDFLVIVGGAPNSISWLSGERVAQASRFLQGADFDELARVHRAALDELFGAFPEGLLEEARGIFEELRAFYLAAAQAGQAVVKRFYA